MFLIHKIVIDSMTNLTDEQIRILIVSKDFDEKSMIDVPGNKLIKDNYAFEEFVLAAYMSCFSASYPDMINAKLGSYAREIVQKAIDARKEECKLESLAEDYWQEQIVGEGDETITEIFEKNTPEDDWDDGWDYNK
jgi:hypothetical protein